MHFSMSLHDLMKMSFSEKLHFKIITTLQAPEIMFLFLKGRSYQDKRKLTLVFFIVTPFLEAAAKEGHNQGLWEEFCHG